MITVLLDREGELEALDAALDAAATGRGRVVVVEGPAGAGKSSLLTAARERAAAAGHRVLSARSGKLERSLPFGALAQLFEPLLRGADAPERARLLAGAAAPAALVLGLQDEDGAAAPVEAVPGFAASHALYWLCANVAAQVPLLLAVDDLHWADGSSLRTLDYLARRIGDLPITLVAALRPEEPGADAGLLDELRAAPGAVRLAPAPLSPHAVATVVRRRFPTADEATCAAALATTAGNPYYLEELLLALGAVGDAPPAAGAAIDALGVASLGDRILRRIDALGPGAPELARAMAVLGDRDEDVARLAVAERMAGLAPGVAGTLAHGLRRIEVLAAEDPFVFAHPLVRTSIYDAIPLADRDAAHLAAGGLLNDLGAPGATVAAQLGARTPSGSAEVATALVQAADRALAHAAPDEAIRCLERALDEEAPAPPRAAILARLGTTEMALRRYEVGAGHLRAGLAEAQEPELRTRIAAGLGITAFVAGRWDEAMAALAAARAEVGDDEAALADLAAIELMVTTYAPALTPVLGLDDARLEALSRGASGAAQTLAAVMAGVAAHRGAGVARVTELADRALASDRLATGADGGMIWGASHAIVALVETEAFDRALAFSHEVTAAAVRNGSLDQLLMAADHRGWVHARAGDLAQAEAELRPGIEAALAVGTPVVTVAQLFYLHDALLDRAGLNDLVALAEGLDDRLVDGTFAGGMLQFTRGRLRALARKSDAAVADLRRALDLAVAARIGPVTLPARSALALALGPGARDEARALVAEELTLARATGLARPVGVALRAQGLLEDSPELLEESVALLDAEGAKLERARSLLALGATLRRAGRRADARGPLGAAAELAQRCGATRLVERARDEQRAAGGRPRRLATMGRDALTASELRIVTLAAAGAANPQIAQELFVSIKTVETHLTHAYRKLGLSGQGARNRLAEALVSNA